MSGSETSGALPFEFRDPPQAQRGPSTPVEAQLDALKDWPDRWAVIGSFSANSTAHSLARRIKRGQYGPGFDAEARKTAEGPTEVFVRYKDRTPEPAWAGP